MGYPVQRSLGRKRAGHRRGDQTPDECAGHGGENLDDRANSPEAASSSLDL